MRHCLALGLVLFGGLLAIDEGTLDCRRLEVRGFEKQPRGPREIDSGFSLRRFSDPAGARVDLAKLGYDEVRRRMADPKPFNAVQPAQWVPNGGFTGLPAGEFSLSNLNVQSGSSSFDIYAYDYAAFGSLQYSGTGPPGKIVWSGKDRPGDFEAMEGTMRSAIARALGKRLGSGGQTRLEGRDMPTKRAPDGMVFVDLRDWAAARRITLNVNDVRCTASFVAGGKTCIVPLSANTIKVGSAWLPVPGYVREIENTWYIPLDDFERHTR